MNIPSEKLKIISHAIVAVIGFPAFGILDLFYYPLYMKELLILRIIVTIYYLILSFIVYFNMKIFHRIWQYVFYIPASFAISLMPVICNDGFNSHYFCGSLLVLTMALISVRSLFQLLTIIFMMWGFHFGVILYYIGIDLKNLVSQLFFIITISTVGIVLNRIINYYITQVELSLEREKILYDQNQYMAKIYTHDVKNYLFACQTSIKRWKPQDFPEKIWNKLSMVKESIEKISRISCNVMNVFNPEEIEVVTEEYKVDDLINRLNQKWQSKFESKGIDYSLNSHAFENIKLAQWEYMELVFDNLISNAFQHTSEGEKLTIEINNQSISIKNTGALVIDQYRKNLFSRDQDLGKRDAFSKGLGLPYCKMICQKMGGNIKYIAHDNGDVKNGVNEFRIIFQ